MQTILGIDPGSRVTGYGIIQSDGMRHRYVSSGCIKMPGGELCQRLQQIFDGIRDRILEYQPTSVAVEQVFMHRNADAALKLGQARGAAIVAAGIHKLPLAEYSARQVKQAVVGYGAASKLQVQHMIKALLKLTLMPETDAADALAVAICHAHSCSGLGKLNNTAGLPLRQGRTVKIRRGRLR